MMITKCSGIIQPIAKTRSKVRTLVMKLLILHSNK